MKYIVTPSWTPLLLPAILGVHNKLEIEVASNWTNALDFICSCKQVAYFLKLISTWKLYFCDLLAKWYVL